MHTGIEELFFHHDHFIFIYFFLGRRESDINRYILLNFIDMYIYTRQTKCKRAKQKYNTVRAREKNTHKHLFHLIHFAVHPLAALCISLERERYEEKNAAIHCLH
jgi:hypothetical protein